MKITYNENPLKSVVELDEHEKKELWYKIKVEEMVELLFEAHFCLLENNYSSRSWIVRRLRETWYKFLGQPLILSRDVKRAKDAVDPSYYLAEHRGERAKMDERVDELFDWYVHSLQDIHGGDCNCIPASCPKCHAESLVGIDTMPGLGKHEAAKIDAYFGKGLNIDGVITALENWELDELKHEGYEPHFERWRNEAKNACEWLKGYKAEHFS